MFKSLFFILTWITVCRLFDWCHAERSLDIVLVIYVVLPMKFVRPVNVIITIIIVIIIFFPCFITTDVWDAEPNHHRSPICPRDCYTPVTSSSSSSCVRKTHPPSPPPCYLSRPAVSGTFVILAVFDAASCLKFGNFQITPKRLWVVRTERQRWFRIILWIGYVRYFCVTGGIDEKAGPEYMLLKIQRKHMYYCTFTIYQK